MLMGFIRGFTRTLGVSQGYRALRIRDGVARGEGGVEYPSMKSLWHFSEKDLAVIRRGGAIELEVLGTGHPPVRLTVVPPEEFDRVVDASELRRGDRVVS